MMQCAARDASGGDRRLRPGLIAEILRFYDLLRRQGKTAARFDELLIEALSKDAEDDRGARRTSERRCSNARWSVRFVML
jgi:hypothetical protein